MRMNPPILCTGPNNVFLLDSDSLHNLVQSCNPFPLLQGDGLLSLCIPVSFLLGRVPFSVQLNLSI